MLIKIQYSVPWTKSPNQIQSSWKNGPPKFGPPWINGPQPIWSPFFWIPTAYPSGQTEYSRDHLSGSTKLVGDHLSMGTELVGDRLSWGTNWLGTNCWGPNVRGPYVFWTNCVTATKQCWPYIGYYIEFLYGNSFIYKNLHIEPFLSVNVKGRLTL